MAAQAGWTPADLPDQAGRTFVVTGANSGLGLAATRLLAGAGAEVVMGCRSAARAQAATDSVRAAVPGAQLHVLPLDLGDLASVTRFAEAVAQGFPRIDVLLNNAGVMMPPQGRTTDGFETQIGVNHLGHLALTLQLLPTLIASSGSRVVTVSSIAARAGRIVLDDLNFDRRPYRRWTAYAQSKLANLLFTAELDARLRAVGAPVLAVAAHPGFSRTELGIGEIPGMRFTRAIQGPMYQSAEMGTMPSLRAATDAGVQGNDYFGPAGPLQSRGPAVRVTRSRRARDQAMAAALWTRSVELVGGDDSLLAQPVPGSAQA